MAKITRASSGAAKAALICDRIIAPTDARTIQAIKKAVASGGMTIGDFDRIAITDTIYVGGTKAKPKSTEYKEGMEIVKDAVETCGYTVVGVMGADTFDKVMGFKGIAKFYGQVLWSDILQCKVVPLVHPGQLVYGDPILEAHFQAGIKLIKTEQETKELVVVKAEVQYTEINTIGKFRQFLKYYLSDAVKVFAYDTETTSLSPERAELLMIQFSHAEKKSYLIPSQYYKNLDTSVPFDTGKPLWTDEQWAEIVAGITQLFADDSKLVIGHNIKYDNRIIHQTMGIPPRKFNTFDTMIAKFLCDETTPSGLKDLSCRFTDMGDYEVGMNVWKKKFCKEQKLKVKDFHYGMFPYEILAPYALCDADCTFRLYNIFKEKLIEEEQVGVMAMVMKFVYLLTKMEINGSPVDTVYAAQYLIDIDAQLVTAKAELDEFKFILDAAALVNANAVAKLKLNNKPTKNYKNKAFNFNSVDQKRTLFYDILGMDIIFISGTKNKISEMTLLRRDNLIRKLAKEIHGRNEPAATFVYKNHKREYTNPLPPDTVNKYLRLKASVDKRSLDAWNKKELKDEVKPFMEKLRRYSELTKIRNTYVFALLEKQVDGWIHPSFNPIGAKSGRLSCRDPNYQNIPAHSDEAKKIKRITKAPEGYVLVGADLSAAEMVWITIASGDIKLADLFNSGFDSHGAIAKDLFNLDCHANEVKTLFPDLRQLSKMCQFLSVYGGKADALSAGSGISVKRAEEVLHDYFETYSGVRDYLDATAEFIKINGYAQSLLGRRNRHPQAPALAQKEMLEKDEMMVLEKEIRVGVNATIQSVSSDGMLLSCYSLLEEIEANSLPMIIINIIHDAVYVLVKDEFLQEGRDLIIKHLTTLPTELYNVLTKRNVVLPVGMRADAECGPSWDKFSHDFGENPLLDDEDDEEEDQGEETDE